MFETICVRRQNFAGPQVMDLGSWPRPCCFTAGYASSSMLACWRN
jgi:hypothetical protein